MENYESKDVTKILKMDEAVEVAILEYTLGCKIDFIWKLNIKTFDDLLKYFVLLT